MPKTHDKTPVDYERRFVPMALAQVELREDAAEQMIEGYAVVWNSPSVELAFGTEIIKRGAFKKSLDGGADVRALVDHISHKILGRNTKGTLKLKEDAHGLRVVIDPPPTTYANDLKESMRRGDIDGMSFGFRTVEDRWRTVDGKDQREVIEAELIDVSVVTFPAYPATEVALRSHERWQEEEARRSGKPIARLERELRLESTS